MYFTCKILRFGNLRLLDYRL